ncbi:MAG: thermonuclease family protein [Aliishimia sp.]
MRLTFRQLGSDLMLKNFPRLSVLLFAAPAFAQDAAPDCGIYAYKAEIVRIIDGDTVVADIDLGFNTWRRGEHLRMMGVEAPEAGTLEGDLATERLRELIGGRELFICTHKMKRKDREAKGSFGRYLATFYFDGKNINELLLSLGLAVPWE